MHKGLDNAINIAKTGFNTHLALIQHSRRRMTREESKSKLNQRARQETIDIARANLITAMMPWTTSEGVGKGPKCA